MTRSTISILGLALAAAAAAPFAAAGAATPAAAPSTVPTADFFNFADVSEPSMAPDGSAVALLVRNTAGRRQLAVVDTADLHKFKVVAGFAEFDIAWVRWADDKTLVFGLGDETQSAWEVRGAGLYSIERDGEGMRTLINFRGQNTETGTMIKARSLDPYAYTFGSALHDGSGDIVVYHWKKSEKLYAYGSE